MLTRSLDLHENSNKPKDKDWINVLLEFLKAYVQDSGKALLVTKEDHIAYTTSLVKSLSEAAADLESGEILNFLAIVSSKHDLSYRCRTS